MPSFPLCTPRAPCEMKATRGHIVPFCSSFPSLLPSAGAWERAGRRSCASWSSLPLARDTAHLAKTPQGEERYRARVTKPFRDPPNSTESRGQETATLPRKPEACPHPSRWLSARQGASPPEPPQMRPDPGGITACCDPAGVGGAADNLAKIGNGIATASAFPSATWERGKRCYRTQR